MAARSSSRAPGLRLGASAPLAAHLVPLVARDHEVEELCRLLKSARLVSLVGVGGSGKTRLAAAVAAGLQGRFRDAVGWIDLAELDDPAAVATHAASTLGLREQPGVAPADALAAMIGDAAALLLLDNCEHVLSGCAALADTLLRGCPALRLLTTSRQAMGIAGERVWLVPPLSVPDVGDGTAASGAVQLFVQRASDVLPSFRLTAENAPHVAHICRRLDGLPLALELAAARVRILPPEQLARRLDSALDLAHGRSHAGLARHRTLRSTLDWSWDLLAEDERRLLRRLAVFSGGFTLDAAEAVAADRELPPDRVLDELAALVDRSLVAAAERQGEARFSLLETVRQYALEKLRETGEEEVLRERHAEWFVEFAEAAEPHVLGGTRGTPWMRRLEGEQGNLRSAAAWCGEEPGRAEAELRLTTALHWLYFALGHFEEPRQRLDHGLTVAADLPAAVEGRALAALGYFAFWTGDPVAAAEPLARGVALLEGLDRPLDQAFAWTGLGAAVGLLGDRGAAEAAFDAADAALGAPGGEGPHDFAHGLLASFASYWRGTVAQVAGDLEGAQAAYEGCLSIAHRFGRHPSVAHPLVALARVRALQGELAGAEACLVEALPLHREREDRWGLLQLAEVAGLLAARRGRPSEAAAALGAADRLRTRSGIALAPHEREARTLLVAALEADIGSPAVAAALRRGGERPLDEVLGEVLPAPMPDGTTGPASGAVAEPSAPPARAVAAADRSAAADAPTIRSGGEGPPAGPRAALDVRALGALRVVVGDRHLDVDAFGSRRARELLVFLLCHEDGCTRDQVGLAFWPEASAAQVKNSFHVTLHRLRKALARPDWIRLADDRYAVDPDVGIAFDAARFEADARAALAISPAAPGGEPRMLAAVELYSGDFLEGESAGDWHLERRDRLRRLHAGVLLALSDIRLAQERFADAAETLERLLGRDRLHEEACRRLMLCYDRTGRRAEALRLFDTFASLLRDELDARPHPSTVELWTRLRDALPA